MNSETKTVKIAKAIIINNSQKIEVFDNIKAIHRPFVSSFYNVLKKNLTENELTNFYNNISTLTIKYKDDILTKLKLNKDAGHYLPDKNTIEIFPANDLNPYNTFNHELLHMASSSHSNEEYHIGFYQITNKANISYALNEGYTEAINNHFFGASIASSGYKYEAILSIIIEKVIGKKEMQNLYFTADLYHLVTKLKEYATYTAIGRFLYNMDLVLQSKQNNTNKEKIISPLLEINLFLYEVFTNWLIDSYQKKTYTINEINEGYHIFTKAINLIPDIFSYVSDELNYDIKDNTEVYKQKIKKLTK